MLVLLRPLELEEYPLPLLAELEELPLFLLKELEELLLT
jgi:hypothetical protein